MKSFAWSSEKNQRLMQERKISFEEIIFYIEKGQLLDIVVHHNPGKYPGQRIFIVEINDYAYLVPFIETEEEIILKTVIPSRKATEKYLRGRDGSTKT